MFVPLYVTFIISVVGLTIFVKVAARIWDRTSMTWRNSVVASALIVIPCFALDVLFSMLEESPFRPLELLIPFVAAFLVGWWFIGRRGKTQDGLVIGKLRGGQIGATACALVFMSEWVLVGGSWLLSAH